MDVVTTQVEHARGGMYWQEALGLNDDDRSTDRDHVLQAIWRNSDMRLGQTTASLLSDRSE